MGAFGDAGGALLGGIAGMFGDDGSQDASNYYKRLATTAGNLNPTITPGVDTTDQSQSQDVFNNLQGIYQKGGNDPIAQSQIAGAEDSANRNATANANSIQEQARSQNMGNSASALALKQAAGQSGSQQAGQQAVQAAGANEQRQLGALGAAGQVAGQISGAKDAVNRFNTTNAMNAQQATFANQQGQLGQEGGFYGQGYGAQQNQDQRSRAMWAGVGQGLGGVADYFNKTPAPGGS